jgi:hypothetical protein
MGSHQRASCSVSVLCKTFSSCMKSSSCFGFLALGKLVEGWCVAARFYSLYYTIRGKRAGWLCLTRRWLVGMPRRNAAPHSETRAASTATPLTFERLPFSKGTDGSPTVALAKTRTLKKRRVRHPRRQKRGQNLQRVAAGPRRGTEMKQTGCQWSGKASGPGRKPRALKRARAGRPELQQPKPSASSWRAVSAVKGRSL